MRGLIFLRGRTARSAATAVLLAGTALGGYAAGGSSFADTLNNNGSNNSPPAVNAGAIPAAAPAPDFSNLVERVAPAVVSITNEMTPTQAADDAEGDQDGQAMPQMPSPFATPHPHGGHGRMGHEEARGSGFIVDADGTIVTNNHVIEHAKTVTVTLADGTVLPAKIIGRDPGSDLAVLRVHAGHALPYLQLGNSDAVRVGQWVIAVGNPFGLSGTVTAGIVSARGRDIGDGPFNTSFIQVDAPINRGNSGGPLLTQDGKVVGVNSAILSPTGGSVGIGFAIPSEIVQRIVADLREHGHIERGWLGVAVQEAAGRTAGVAISSVDRSGPAAHAGLRAGDVVTALNGARIETARGLIRAVAATPPGTGVRLTVRRQGNDLEIPVTVGRRPTDSAG